MMKRVVTRRVGRILLSGFLVLNILAGYTVRVQVIYAQALPDAINTDGSGVSVNVPQYSGVQDSIRDYLCVPDDNNLGTALYTCITKLYRFGIAFGAIALVFFVVYAGYVYITGGEASKQKGKSILVGSLTGMAIILSSYVLLRFINPDLVKIKPIQPPIFSAANLPTCESVGFGRNCVLPTGQVHYPGGSTGGSYGGRGCNPITNNDSPASVDNLGRTCWGRYGANVIKNASIVAANESGGRPIDVSPGSCGAGRRPARCSGGEVPVYGVFQINIAAHKIPDGSGNLLDCPSAFTRGSATFCSNGCTVTNKDLYNRCYQAVKNIQNEFSVACRLYDASIAAGRPGFNDWGNRPNEHGNKCGF